MKKFQLSEKINAKNRGSDKAQIKKKETGAKSGTNVGNDQSGRWTHKQTSNLERWMQREPGEMNQSYAGHENALVDGYYGAVKARLG